MERTAQAAADPSGTPKIEQLPGDSGPSSRSTTVHSSIPERHRESKGQKQRLGSQTDSAPSSGNTTPRLQTSSGTQSPCHQHSLSDVESGFSRVSISDSFSLTQEFVNEMTNDYDSMEDDLLGTKEMLLELQEMVSLSRINFFVPAVLCLLLLWNFCGHNMFSSCIVVNLWGMELFKAMR